MKNPYFIVLCGLLSLTACQTTREPHDLSRPQENEYGYAYDPAGKEQFALREQGYDYKFCTRDHYILAIFDPVKTCGVKELSYKKYTGMKGYFETPGPVNTESYGKRMYEFHPVVLENGKKYYLEIKQGEGRFSETSQVIPLELYLESEAFKPEALVPGSAVEILRMDIKAQKRSYFLSNNERKSEEELKLIRDLSGRFGNKPEIADLLAAMEIKDDKIDQRIFISPKDGKVSRSGAKAYIGLHDKKSYLRFKVTYFGESIYGERWLGAKSYKVAADDFRWQSPPHEFERDHGKLPKPASMESDVAKAESALADAETAMQNYKQQQNSPLNNSVPKNPILNSIINNDANNEEKNLQTALSEAELAVSRLKLKQSLNQDKPDKIVMWEWVDVPATGEVYKVAKALAEAKLSTIRFQGEPNYSDQVLEEDQKNFLKQILRLYALMNGK
jgi:hypothetical protein